MDTSIPGLYDLLLQHSDIESIGDTTQFSSETLGTSDANDYLVDYFSAQLLSKLSEGGLKTIEAKVQLIEQLSEQLHLSNPEPPSLIQPTQRLLAVHPDQPTPPVRPETGVTHPWLFTQENSGPSLKDELLKELASADRVDILVSFITMSGVRKLLDVLSQITTLNTGGITNVSIRIVTTTYMGATERSALDVLAKLPGCEVRVSLDGKRSRLHAKAWIFHRNSGFSTAYVGSANLSKSALVGGIEWTMKFTQRAQQRLVALAEANFETLWNDREFQAYDPENEAHRVQLQKALRVESNSDRIGFVQTFFDIEPKPYQQEMLDRIAYERAENRQKNLVVAATGTGKTVVAALDYKRLCRQLGGRPKLLFVAHQQRILDQALNTYRQVLRDPNFGELLGGGANPASHDHLFTTIQSAVSREIYKARGPNYWQIIVIDECHRVAANSFQSLIQNVRPDFLLGLTATPERTDGQPILQHFDPTPRGGPTVELRLWHALDLQLVTPFEYYGCDDPTNLSNINWRGAQGTINSELAKVFDANEQRAKAVWNAWARLAGDIKNSKAIAFCVSVAHAKFMANFFNENGVPAAAITGQSNSQERSEKIGNLQNGAITVLCTVDLFNEGVDIPEIDTLLLLRPTQSALLFQQQIGRGLRLREGKESCLVLDFIGQYGNEFRFDTLLSSITGQNKKQLVENAESGFSRLPTGCHIHLERQTRERVLTNLRSAATTNWNRLRSDLQHYYSLNSGGVSLIDFISDQGIELGDIYRNNATRSGWTALKRDAGLLSNATPETEAILNKRLHSLLHHNDATYIDFIRKICLNRGTSTQLSKPDLVRLQMLHYQFDTRQNTPSEYSEWLNGLQQAPEIANELVELSELLIVNSNNNPLPIHGLTNAPLNLHCAYSRNEILTAIGYFNSDFRLSHREGKIALKKEKIEVLFVTLDKSEGFHSEIAYHDYAISPQQFHWQTQRAAGSHTDVGRRYIDSESNGWTFQLFVRSQPKQAFFALGPVTMENWEGSKPISITWKLKDPMPIELFRKYSVVRDQ